jgi:hypothetical protein
MLRAVLVAALLIALSGCTAATVTPKPASTTLPDGVTLELHQTRSDVGQRRLEVSVHNGTGTRMTVTRLAFDSTQFVEPVEWQRAPTTIAAGLTVDLPVLLPEAACDGAEVVASISVDYELDDGRSGSATATPGDPENRMPQLQRDDCFAQSVADVAGLSFVDPPRTVTVDGVSLAQLDLVVTPTGGTGSFTIERTDSSTLVSPADPDTGETLSAHELEVTVNGTDAPSVITLTIAPNRCDPHAVAEDKRGTFFGLFIRNGTGEEAFLYVPSPDPVRKGIYDYVTHACGYA